MYMPAVNAHGRFRCGGSINDVAMGSAAPWRAAGGVYRLRHTRVALYCVSKQLIMIRLLRTSRPLEAARRREYSAL